MPNSENSVYASNRAPVAKMWRGIGLYTSVAAMAVATEKQPKLKLFPQKVKSDATVYAVFAISDNSRGFAE